MPRGLMTFLRSSVLPLNRGRAGHLSALTRKEGKELRGGPGGGRKRYVAQQDRKANRPGSSFPHVAGSPEGWTLPERVCSSAPRPATRPPGKPSPTCTAP